MDSEDDLFDTISETIESDEVETLSSIIDMQNDSEDEFITPSSNFGIHWTGFLRSKQVKNTKSHVIESYQNEDTDMSSKKHRVDLTDFFNKGSILPEKADELHTLLLKSLIYGNIPCRFVENPYFALFLKKLHSSYNLP
ncbi:5259_t:CDS:2, partial [Gigaspora rosea]